MTNEAFVQRYDLERAEDARTQALRDEGFVWCRPTGRIWAHRLTTENVERYFPTGSFEAAWGEMMIVDAGDWLAMPYPGGGEVYRIAAAAFAREWTRERVGYPAHRPPELSRARVRGGLRAVEQHQRGGEARRSAGAGFVVAVFFFA